MSIKVEQRERSAVYAAGGVSKGEPAPLPRGRTVTRYEGVIYSSEGIIAVTGYEWNGGTQPAQQQWWFEVGHPNNVAIIERRETRTRRDFLTATGAKRVALRWVRGLWN